MNGLGGGIGSGAGDNLHASGVVLDGNADDFEMFVGSDGGRFAGGPDGNDSGDTSSSLAIDEGAESVVINGAVAERGDERGVSAFEHAGLLAHFAAGGKSG